MEQIAKWIWLDRELYPQFEKNGENSPYCVAEFKKTYEISAPYTIRISADVRYLLYINGEQIGRGPTSPGSDFLFGKMEYGYFEEYEIDKTGSFEIRVLVSSKSTVLTEYPFGYPGLWVEIVSNGKVIGVSDESWEARPLVERKDVLLTDYTEKEKSFTPAKATVQTHSLLKSSLDKLTEEIIKPNVKLPFTVNAGEIGELEISFDKIYSAYPYILINATDTCAVTIESSEFSNVGFIREEVITDKRILHHSLRMRSIGQMKITVENRGSSAVSIENVFIKFIHYPVYNEGYLKTSDELINKIYSVCMHTLKICRQGIHLDSPTHQEHLACTGDYYIQALIEYLNMYDPTLTRLDILRTAEILRIQDGRLFHTSYSLIYPEWIYDYYQHTGDIELVNHTLPSLKLLLNRFDKYISSENGLIEYSPDYMFVDWVIAEKEKDAFLDGGELMTHGKMEGYSLHHPPKALGQSVLCMLYYNALNKINAIFTLVGEEKIAAECEKKAKCMKECINKHLFDKEKGLYKGGLNTPNYVESNAWLPENTSTVYYLKQANILAILYGIARDEDKERIKSHILKKPSIYEIQPYFYHFLFSALYKEGDFERYGISLARRYESILKKCDKGLGEAWENMNCDHSHAWGASVAYHIKKALSGFEILEPGYKKVKLNPNLMGLDYAELDITTPYGSIELSLKKGERVSINAPSQIQIIWDNEQILK